MIRKIIRIDKEKCNGCGVCADACHEGAIDIIDGKADKSYGINVARLAHLPKVVLDRAAQLLTNFENQDNNQNYQPSLFVMEQVQPEKSKLLQQLQELDIDSMTPRDALDCLYELKKLSEKIEL